MAPRDKAHEQDQVSAARRATRQKAQTSNKQQRPLHPALALKRAASEPPAALGPAEIRALHRTVGNRAVGRVLGHQPQTTPPQPSAPAGAIQRKAEDEETLQGKVQTGERRENRTGLPDRLKSGVENLSGISLDEVKVHYNSPKPAGVQALAYTQGTDIHVAPGQEEHLPHEAWHVVQQKQGRVKPTLQLKGEAINDEPGLEREADLMGARVQHLPNYERIPPPAGVHQFMVVMQRVLDPAKADAKGVKEVIEDKNFAENHCNVHVLSKAARPNKFTTAFKSLNDQVNSALHLIQNHKGYAATKASHKVEGAIPAITAYAYMPGMPAWMKKKNVAKGVMYLDTDATSKIIGIRTVFPEADI
ncbi:MAG: DUF4157 domain-containing protein [Pyrinomonadaceae bacterium]